ncbi:long-chain fatty acid--CoA ligase [uncultured Roseobacter sp.]|uniref:long-chain fatty acid--CoA ligase n=1 Tax=uncultured Roseobacter sp. TaxID=114847 RepID=UPI002621BF9E|nr:long-chain fatty acid--CoA ligase [uncultured Roseobacter sp.]
MLGQMMTAPLLISSQIAHAARYHSATEIISVSTDGSVEITDWATVGRNARQLAAALTALRLDPQTRCATIAWNNRRHLEIYFGASGGGLVCHTINPRLFPDQLVYIINHAEDEVLFLDTSFVPLVASIRDRLKTVRHLVLLEPDIGDHAGTLPGLIAYDDLLSGGSADDPWPVFDEQTASSLCYTSGTTGNPKGVLFSHRSTVLHSLACNLADSLNLSAMDTVLPVVPMFHVNAWGSPYAAAMVGARMVLPGPGLDGASLVALIDRYGVSVALGVPTIWLGLLGAAEAAGSTLSSLKRTIVGGSACPPSMMTAFRDRYGVETIHAWGMTEMSPIGSVNQPTASHRDLAPDALAQLRENQGRPPWGVELKIVDAAGAPLPHDGRTEGRLLVRGHFVLDAYFRMSQENTLQEGWFDTGDIATLDADGYLNIRDRAKDIIKSGGEWISSVELENIAIAHPALSDAAVIGAPHPKWDERPVLVAVRAPDHDPSEQEILDIYDGKIAKWQIPDRVTFVDTLPRNATGKVLKRDLRDTFADILQ